MRKKTDRSERDHAPELPIDLDDLLRPYDIPDARLPSRQRVLRSTLAESA
jgi:hypothetical protein